MKVLQIVHVVITVLLLLVVTGFSFLVLVGQLEVRITPKASVNGHSPVNPASGGTVKPIGSKAGLVVVRGLKPGVEFQLFEGRNYIGRADEKTVEVDIQDQEPPDRIWSSRQHALITCENGSLKIEDLNSANGTYVNRNRVPPGQQLDLKAKDIIQIGTVQLQLVSITQWGGAGYSSFGSPVPEGESRASTFSLASCPSTGTIIPRFCWPRPLNPWSLPLLSRCNFFLPSRPGTCPEGGQVFWRASGVRKSRATVSVLVCNHRLSWKSFKGFFRFDGQKSIVMAFRQDF